MSRHHAPATEGEMDRLLLIAPTDTVPIRTDSVAAAPDPCDRGDEDDIDDFRTAALLWAGAITEAQARQMDREARMGR